MLGLLNVEQEHQITLQHGTQQICNIEITGVQLEVGSVATDFEHRSFVRSLLYVKRYF